MPAAGRRQPRRQRWAGRREDLDSRRTPPHRLRPRQPGTQRGDVLQLYGFPEADACTAPAARPTTTPLQQLFVMNSPFLRDQAAALAGRGGNEPRPRTKSRRCTARCWPATRRERELDARRDSTSPRGTTDGLRPGAALHQRGDLLAMNRASQRRGDAAIRAGGLGMIGLADLLADDALAPPLHGRPALRAEGEAQHRPLHARRPVADGSVRSRSRRSRSTPASARDRSTCAPSARPAA